MQTNMEVDYVLVFRFATTGRWAESIENNIANAALDKATAVSNFEKLVKSLAQVGLATEVRNGESNSVLVFVKNASKEHLYGEVYRSR